MALRLLVITLFLCSAAISFLAYRKSGVYHFIGIAFWCMHVVVFTVIAMLVAIGFLTIDYLWLNMWSNTVRLHGGIMALSSAIFYVARPKIEIP